MVAHPSSLTDHRQLALPVDGALVRTGLEITIARTRSELNEAGTIRRLAYAAAGKVPESTAPLLDEVDSCEHTRVLVIRRDGRAVATSRIVMPSLESDLTDHLAFFSWPRAFPRPEFCAEVSRVAVLPDEDRRGLGRLAMQAAVLEALQNGRRFFVCSAAGSLCDLYKALGCRAISTTYRHAVLANLEHEVLVLDLIGAIRGHLPISHAVWWFYWAPILRAAMDRGLELCVPDLAYHARCAAARLSSATLTSSWR